MVFFATSMFSSQSAFAGGLCLSDTECNSAPTCQTGGECGKDFPGVCGYDNESDGTTCDDGNDCRGPDECDGAGTCRGPPTFGSCDDGNDCTVSDSCQGFRDPDIGNFPLGICDGDPVSGAPCNDGDGNECTGVCSTGECFPTALGDGSSCGAGGTECSNQDTCVSGSCQPNDKPDDTSCDDGELCTIGELCTDGVCGMGSVNPILACMPDIGDGQSVGGKIIPIEATSLILAGTQTTVSWLIPVTVSAIGIAIVIARKFSKYQPV